MATRTISDAGGNWTSTSAWVEGVVPTSADDVVATATSGNLTTTGTPNCRSANFTNYAGTLTVSSALNIGHSTPGPSDVALLFSSGMTIVANNTINFVSTSATQQTITSNGRNVRGYTFNGLGGSWIFTDAMNITVTPAYYGIYLIQGSLDTNNQTIDCYSMFLHGTGVRAITLGSSVVNIKPSAIGYAMGAIDNTNMTFSGGNSTVVLEQTAANNYFAGGGLTWGTLKVEGGGANNWTFYGNNSFLKLERIGTGAKTVMFFAGTTTTLRGGADAFFSGTSGNLFTCKSTTNGSAWNLSKSSGTVESSYLSLQDSVASGGATFTASSSTNVSGNSGWQFSVDGRPGVTTTQHTLAVGCTL